MIYDNSKLIWIPQYEFVSANQHGDRFKRKSNKSITVASLVCEIKDNSFSDLKDLVLF